jgi:two-component system, chemotaxis family, protein-glutamate methylesterase/glutaminase
MAEDRRLFERDADEHPRSLLVCPDCGGVLWEIEKERPLATIAARSGMPIQKKAWSQLQSNQLENALWTAVRALRRTIHAIHDGWQTGCRKEMQLRSEQQFLGSAQEADSKPSEIIRKFLLDGSLLNAASMAQIHIRREYSLKPEITTMIYVEARRKKG